jgi:hypothetical protein
MFSKVSKEIILNEIVMVKMLWQQRNSTAWHIRVHSAYADDITAMLGGSMDWPDLVTTEDLSLFWIGMSDLVYSDLEPLLDHIIFGSEFDRVQTVVGQSLVDYG